MPVVRSKDRYHLIFNFCHCIERSDDIIIIKDLIDDGLDLNKTMDLPINDPYYSISPLSFAVSNQRENIVRMLIDHGANPNGVDGELKSPIHYANPKNSTILKILIDSGADINKKTPVYGGDTALDICYRSGDQEGSEILIALGAIIS